MLAEKGSYLLKEFPKLEVHILVGWNKKKKYIYYYETEGVLNLEMDHVILTIKMKGPEDFSPNPR